MRRFARPPGQPAVLRDGARGWPALQRWRFADFVRRFGHEAFILDRHLEQDYAVLARLDDFAAYCRNEGAKERNPMYIFDDNFGGCEQLLDEYKAPSLCDDLLSRISEDERPPHRWILAGPRRSGSFPHRDPLGSSAWNATVVGAKRWVMLPPDVDEAVVFCRHRNSATPDTFGWFDELDEVLRRLEPAQLARTVDFTSKAGDIVWIPAGWWHAAINVAPWTAAVTENFVVIHELDCGHRGLAGDTLDRIMKSDGDTMELLQEALAGSPDEALLEHF